MQVVRTAAQLRTWRAAHAAERLALVPTMGYLHRGHIALVEHARTLAPQVAATIFVNPTQFGPNEDLSRYPRNLQGDLEMLRAAGTDVVFTPEPAEIYPPGFDTYVVPEALASGLCGASRPGHFRGVCTVVTLLLRMSRCDVAVFGEKDYQQLQIIRRMAQDLWLDVDIVGVPIVREADGLAMSSRNAYLSPEERRHALGLSEALAAVQQAHAGGERRTEALRQVAMRVLEPLPQVRIDYVSLVDVTSLQPVPRADAPTLCALAVFIGKTRLIDNTVLRP